MQQYELLFILPGTLGEGDVEPAVSSVSSVISEKGGKVLSIEDMGKSRLAYPMRHIRYGYFRVCRFEATPAAVVEIQQKLRLMNELLRVLLTAVDPKNSLNKIQFAMPSTEREDGNPAPREREIVLAPAAAQVQATAPAEDKRIKLEDIDKKLDEILEKDIAGQM